MDSTSFIAAIEGVENSHYGEEQPRCIAYRIGEGIRVIVIGIFTIDTARRSGRIMGSAGRLAGCISRSVGVKRIHRSIEPPGRFLLRLSYGCRCRQGYMQVEIRSMHTYRHNKR